MADRIADENAGAPAAEARRLMRRGLKAALATLGSDHEAAAAGWPAAALVSVATAWDASPILLLSTLAHHTRNLLADARASLLIDATEGFANPQAGPRVAAMGRIGRTEDAALAARFLARHPAARAYAGFGDFAFYKMTVERLHYVGGFARARWIPRAEAVLPEAAWRDIARHEADILAHMNDDHADTLALYAERLLGARAKRARLIAVDPEGFDLRCGRSVRRIDFAAPVTDLSQIRAAFVALARDARGASSER